MYNRFKHIATIYLLIAIIFASVGVRLYTSYCACEEMYSVSVSGAEACCTDHEHSQCRTDADHEHDQNTGHADGCCKENSVFIKISDSYVGSKMVCVGQIWSCAVLIGAFRIAHIERQLQTDTRINAFLLFCPRLYGRTLITFIKSYKIPVC